jgi:hypothetical protein
MVEPLWLAAHQGQAVVLDDVAARQQRQRVLPAIWSAVWVDMTMAMYTGKATMATPRMSTAWETKSSRGGVQP